MKQIDISTKIIVCHYNELSEEEKNLVNIARSMPAKSYAPYSRFRVGAAVLLADGRIITGSNQENASYPNGLCAERVALFSAGATAPDIPAVAIALAAENDKGIPIEPITPCGACRQVMHETEMRYDTPLRVLMCGCDKIYISESAKVLLPLSFAL